MDNMNQEQSYDLALINLKMMVKEGKDPFVAPYLRRL